MCRFHRTPQAHVVNTNAKLLSGSPGLVVMGDSLCSRGCGFKSRHCILDIHNIFHIDLLINCIFCSKKTKNKQNEAGVSPFKKFFAKTSIPISTYLQWDRSWLESPGSLEEVIWGADLSPWPRSGQRRLRSHDAEAVAWAAHRSPHSSFSCGPPPAARE